MILKLVAFGFLLALLAGTVWLLPVLWELAIVVAIGGVYWFFFRQPPSAD